MALDDYQAQVLKLKRWNKLVTLATAGLILFIFFALLGYAMWQGSKSRAQHQAVLEYIEQQRQITSVETGLNREGGDIIRCMLLITNTVEPQDRTIDMINKCYPGGSPEAWAKARAEALRE